MIGAHISPFADSRRVAAELFLSAAEPVQVVYVCPDNSLPEAEWIRDRAFVCSFEDLTKRDQWLTINSMIGPGAALIMEKVSRYPKITSNNFVHMQRLSKRVGHKMLLDVVPFTMGVEYIYTPYSCLDRSILGFAHWYAFRECYDEMDDDGKIVSSHDPSVIAKKIAAITTCDGSSLLTDRSTVLVECGAAEMAGYEAKKAECFSELKSPVKIITRLADFSHAFKSRTDAAVDVAQGAGRALFLTNLASYAGRLAKALKKAGTTSEAGSYALAAARQDLDQFDAVVYMESPIIKSYLAFDIEARMRRDARVITLLSDAKVDIYLHNRAQMEIESIMNVTNALLRLNSGKKALYK